MLANGITEEKHHLEPALFPASSIQVAPDVSVLWGAFPTPLLSLSGGDNDLLQSVALSGGVPSACLDAMAVDLCGRTEGGSSRGEAGLGARGCGRVGKAGEGRPG